MVCIRDSSLKKYAPLRREELIHRDDIDEILYPLKESDTDYITMSGNVYKYYYDNLYFKKKSHINKHNGYIYVNITCKDDKNRSQRLHVLMAKTFLFNPNPKKYKIVGHKDNNKTNCEISNLYWTDNQENTQKAVDDGLNIFKKAEENESSTYIKVIDKETNKVVGVYGSLRECERCIDNIALSTISKVYKKIIINQETESIFIKYQIRLSLILILIYKVNIWSKIYQIIKIQRFSRCLIVN